MTHLGEQWIGVCLDGRYTLNRHVGEIEPDRAEPGFLEATDSSGEPVLVKVIPWSADGEERLQRWRRIAYLQHPHLLRLLSCGREELPESGECLYAVFELPDDRLSTALEHGPLGEEDAREFLIAALDAVRYLHAQGLVHGSIDAANVVAVGSTIKLTTGDLREPDSGPFSYANDIGALGGLLYQILTGHEFRGESANLAGPYATIVRNTAGAAPADRWRIPEILAALPPAPVAPPPAPVIEEPAKEEPPAEAAPAPPSPVESVPAVPPPVLRLPPPRTRAAGVPMWAWPVSLAAIAACIAWVLHTPEAKKTPAPASPVYAPAPAPLPAQPKPAAPATPAPPVESAAANAPHERVVWRVIAYTYNAWRDAEKKALAINQKWPGMNAEVFAPKGTNHPPYLVALGGRMNRLEAARILQKARSRGLPHDTFMLNFSD